MPGKTITRQSLQTTKVRYICTDIRNYQYISISAVGLGK